MVDVALGWRIGVRKVKGRCAWRDEASKRRRPEEARRVEAESTAQTRPLFSPATAENALFWFLDNAQQRNGRLKLAELQPRSHTSVKDRQFGTPRCNHLNFAGPSW